MEEFCGMVPATCDREHRKGAARRATTKARRNEEGHDVSCPYAERFTGPKTRHCKSTGRELLLAGVGEQLVHADDLPMQRAGNQGVTLYFASLRVRNSDVVRL